MELTSGLWMIDLFGTRAISAFIKTNAQAAKMTADRFADRSVMLADAACENNGVDTSQGNDHS